MECKQKNYPENTSRRTTSNLENIFPIIMIIGTVTLLPVIADIYEGARRVKCFLTNKHYEPYFV